MAFEELGVSGRQRILQDAGFGLNFRQLFPSSGKLYRRLYQRLPLYRVAAASSIKLRSFLSNRCV